MNPGTIIKLPDEREATVVYSGLDGYGIVWGRVEVKAEALRVYQQFKWDVVAAWDRGGWTLTLDEVLDAIQAASEEMERNLAADGVEVDGVEVIPQ